MSDTLQGVLARYDTVVEVGVGNRPGLAVALAEADTSVTVTDVTSRSLPPEIRFVVDDITDPDLSVYEDADAIVAQRLPPELQRPVVEVAETVDAACYFTTLGGDPAVVPVTPRTIESGTLYVARE